MKTISASDAKQKFGQLIDMAQKEAVTITNHGRSVAVLISLEDYERDQERKLKLLKARLAAAAEEVKQGETIPFDDAVAEAMTVFDSKK